jgi:hypothetical protein
MKVQWQVSDDFWFSPQEQVRNFERRRRKAILNIEVETMLGLRSDARRPGEERARVPHVVKEIIGIARHHLRMLESNAGHIVPPGLHAVPGDAGRRQHADKVDTGELTS